MMKAQAWLHKHRSDLGLFDHEAAMYELAAQCVREVIVPDEEELNLIRLYGNRGSMKLVEYANVAAVEMVDPRNRLGLGWFCLAGVGLATGVAIAVKGHRTASASVLGAVALGTTLMGCVGYTSRLRRWWDAAWEWPAA